MRFALPLLGLTMVAALGAGPALAGETVSYRYDARGRLVEVVRSGGPAAGRVVRYTHDRADNRVRRQVTATP